MNQTVKNGGDGEGQLWIKLNYLFAIILKFNDYHSKSLWLKTGTIFGLCYQSVICKYIVLQ